MNIRCFIGLHQRKDIVRMLPLPSDLWGMVGYVLMISPGAMLPYEVRGWRCRCCGKTVRK
jgi:hypothetical protein